MKRKSPCQIDSRPTFARLLGALVVFAIASIRPARAAVEKSLETVTTSATGVLAGLVSNSATGNLLEGAAVELPQLGLKTLTDATGRYVFSGVPIGTLKVVASYSALDSLSAEVSITAGHRVTQDFHLTTGIYKMAEFVVAGEREGGAAAITAQRNAPNVKNVVAMDSYGNLPNMSVGEVVMRLPGIAGDLNDEGLAYHFNVRGIDSSLNTVTMDGSLLPSIYTHRDLELQSVTATMFDRLELIKGQTPDKGVDSLGGTLDLKTRSPLDIREKRRVNYNASIRIAPSFTEQIPLREAHRSHPLLSLNYQEVFGVLGGERNLGIGINAFYSENAVGGFSTSRQFQNTTSDPAYLWSYQTRDNYNNRIQESVNVKIDYRYSFNTKISFNVTGNNNLEWFRRGYSATAKTGSATVIPNATTSGIIPGFTDDVTQVRAVPGSVIDVAIGGPVGYIVRTYHVDAGAEHEFGRLKLDYNAGISRNSVRSGVGAGSLTNEIKGVGWTLDRSQSDLYPRFVQTSGPDILDPANYRPIANGLTISPYHALQRVRQARANALYSLPTAAPMAFKTGVAWREHSSGIETHSRRWNYIGTQALPTDPTISTFAALKTGLHLPQWEVAAFTKDGAPSDPALWAEDRYFAESTKYTGTKGGIEDIAATYAMVQGRFGRQGWLGRTGYLAGVRWERTETEGYGYVRSRIAVTAAEQTSDPVGAAKRNYASNWRDVTGRYTKSFPSVHLTHDVNANLKARLSWSTSMGRPDMSNFQPNESANETTETLTVNNPGLRPQMATNWDATLEYYFEPAGLVSAGWFHKEIKDFIVSGAAAGVVPGGADNGFNGEYEGFMLRSPSNAGIAFVQGWEFNYQQQFTFLPGLLKTLSGSANYTVLDTHGDFGGTAYLGNGQVEGFIPQSGNAVLSWRYKKFSTRVLYNYTGEHITSYSAAVPAQNIYLAPRRTVSLGVAYHLRPALSFTLDVPNLFNEAQRFYVFKPNRMQRTVINFVTITAGVSGQF
jgi:TonB-dependent receptor